jgi:hypothetical protein
MGEDIMTDELTEEQHQVHELHLLTFTVGVRCRDKPSQIAGGQGHLAFFLKDLLEYL